MGGLEQYHLTRLSSKQRLVYFPDMDNSEILVFKQGAYDVSEGQAVTPLPEPHKHHILHTAFLDPTAPRSAVPRKAICCPGVLVVLKKWCPATAWRTSRSRALDDHQMIQSYRICIAPALPAGRSLRESDSSTGGVSLMRIILVGQNLLGTFIWIYLDDDYLDYLLKGSQDAWEAKVVCDPQAYRFWPVCKKFVPANVKAWAYLDCTEQGCCSCAASHDATGHATSRYGHASPHSCRSWKWRAMELLWGFDQLNTL